MALTSAQLATLKAAILADNTLNAFPNTDNGNGDLANALNAIASPDWLVWQTAVPVDAINDAITWANFTPQDTPDNTVTWSNRSLACQGKQFNLQTMLVGRSTPANQIFGPVYRMRSRRSRAARAVQVKTAGGPTCKLFSAARQS